MEKNNKKKLMELIDEEVNNFKTLSFQNSIVENSIPIIWFGDVEKYFASKTRIITVSLNPSDNEFKLSKTDAYSPVYRFPSFDDSNESLYVSYNEYFTKKPYNAWFKASFGSVLSSFSASFYIDALNTAIHTDIGSPYATSPTWSGLNKTSRLFLEEKGSASWHKLIQQLEPDVILYSASLNFEKKIKFDQIGEWYKINVQANRPLLIGKFQVAPQKPTSVFFQIQGRKPFLQTSKEEKLKFATYL